MIQRRYRAAWVLPVDRAPIPDAAVLLDRHGRIAAVGPNPQVPDPPGAEAFEFPEGAILPGLVNAHTHLELTGLEGRIDEPDFPAWIRKVIALKAGRTDEEFLAAARQGVRDCWAQGITTVADTGDSGAVPRALAELRASGIAYLEVFGPHPDHADSQFAAFVQRLDALSCHAVDRVRLGVSPHAPYSVSGPLYRMVARLAHERGYPVAVHIAESAEETALLESATGGFAAAWEARGIPLPRLPGRSPIAWLEEHGVLGPNTLCIHVVRATGQDLSRLSRRGAAIAHCPRSNARHGHGAAPLAAMLQHRIRVGLGTDSVASVAPLTLLAEARAARELAPLDEAAALRFATLDGARALGLEAEIGSLTPGKWGDLAVFRLTGSVDAAHLAGSLLSPGSSHVAATFLAGREVWRSPA